MQTKAIMTPFAAEKPQLSDDDLGDAMVRAMMQMPEAELAELIAEVHIPSWVKDGIEISMAENEDGLYGVQLAYPDFDGTDDEHAAHLTRVGQWMEDHIWGEHPAWNRLKLRIKQ